MSYDPLSGEPAPDALAKQRFMAMQVMRLFGVALFLFGIVIIRGILPLPRVAGYVLAVVGIFDMFIMPVILARMARALEAQGPFTLAALHTLASLAASLVVAMAAIAPGADAEVLWYAANLEEDWQAELWGKDAEAEILRARRLDHFAGAMHFAELAQEG